MSTFAGPETSPRNDDDGSPERDPEEAYADAALLDGSDGAEWDEWDDPSRG